MGKRKSLRDRFSDEKADPDAEAYALLKETISMARQITGERGEAQALTARISALRTLTDLLDQDDKKQESMVGSAEDTKLTATIKRLAKEGRTEEQIIEQLWKGRMALMAASGIVEAEGKTT